MSESSITLYIYIYSINTIHPEGLLSVDVKTGEKILFHVSLNCYIIGVVRHSGLCVKCDLYIRWTSGSIDLDLG